MCYLTSSCTDATLESRSDEVFVPCPKRVVTTVGARWRNLFTRSQRSIWRRFWIAHGPRTAVARACGARAPERCPDRLSAGRLRVVQARPKACPERRRRGGRRHGSAKSGGADTTKGTETSRSSIQPEQTDKQLRYTSHLSNFGCLASQSRFRKYELPSNGTSTLAPSLTCDSTNAKSSSLFALASRTPHRVSPPLSNA